jgi:hypothetical protein
VEEECAVLITGRTAQALFSIAHVFIRVLAFSFVKAAPLWDCGQVRNTVVAVVEVLGCAPRNDPNQLLKIWFATFRRRVFSQAFRNQFPPVK